jgi:uncharacterized protein (TIGR02757 family)
MKNNLDYNSLKEYLNEKFNKFANLSFIENDPISIPHQFSKKEDIEISGLITATIAWGQRKSILKNANDFMQRMDNSPHDFIINHSKSDLASLKTAVHRTFNGEDLTFFVKSLQNIYTNYESLESVFCKNKNPYSGMINFYNVFFSIPYPERTKRHVANVSSGSAAKRLNMFLRWMVRKDTRGVDFGIWNNILQADLYIPLDVHSGRIARLLGLLIRKQNDWKAVDELTKELQKFDPNDPVKYDFALFGVGVNEDF